MLLAEFNFFGLVATSRRQRRPFGRGFLSYVFVWLTIIMCAGCQGPSPSVAQSPPGTKKHRVYTLGPGDRVRVTVFEHDEISGEFEVDSVGRMALPLIRGIDAKGLTIPELEQTITEHLEENAFLDPKVSVDLVRSRPFCVLGEVRNPGCFDYIYGMRAAMAIANAGGYTYRAKEGKFVVTREDGNKVMGNHDTPIFPGDIIEVAERFF
jgi:polysaccharide export outer membrane protein